MRAIRHKTKRIKFLISREKRDALMKSLIFPNQGGDPMNAVHRRREIFQLIMRNGVADVLGWDKKTLKAGQLWGFVFNYDAMADVFVIQLDRVWGEEHLSINSQKVNLAFTWVSDEALSEATGKKASSWRIYKG